MKRGLVVLALAIVMAAVAPANAASNSWFELTGASGPGVSGIVDLDVTMGENVALEIIKPAAPGEYTFVIDWYVHASATGGLAVALDLDTDAGNVLLSGNAIVPGINWFGGSDAGQANPGAGDAHAFRLLNNMFGNTFPGYGGMAADQTAIIGTFTLTVNKPPLGAIEIFAGIGNGGFADGDGTAADVFFGGNGVSLLGSDVNAMSALPSIVITNVPEPATVALLVVGGIAMLRRRR